MHYHQRTRRRRSRRASRTAAAAVRCLALLVLVAAGVAGLRLVSAGIHHYADSWGGTQGAGGASLARLAGPRAGSVHARNRRLVYPYSVIPGGISSAAELRDAAAHDVVVGEHYAGFNYDRARVIVVDHPRLVYLSYRRGGRVHWSSKQASLHSGEKLITDGKITARERCGNQVSVLPQSNTAPDEPLVAELDQPDAVASGIELPSGGFNSNLLNPEPVMPIGPGSGGTPAGGGFTPVFPGPPGVSMPFPVGPPISVGGNVCVPGKENHKCKHEPPPPAVPEPGTWVLLFSGAALVVVRYRLTRA